MRLKNFCLLSAMVLIAACNISAGMWNNYSPDKYYVPGYFHKAGTDSIQWTVNGIDTVRTDTVLFAGFPYHSQGWVLGQTNDSVAVVCSLYTTLNDSFYCIGIDASGIKSYAQIMSLTAPASGFKEISMPVAWKGYLIFYYSGDTGTGCTTRAPYYKAPRGE